MAGQRCGILEATVDVWQITLATLRRWYIFIPLLALTGAGVYLAGESVHPEYEVAATALITPGRAPAMVPNPYGGQTQAVSIVLNSTEVQAQIAAEGLAPTYQLSARSRSTIMNVSVRADDPQVALATGSRVFELAAEELSTRQSAAGLTVGAQYRLDILAEPSVQAVVYDGKRQVQAVVGVLGAGLALLVAVLFDDLVGLYRRRRAKRRRRRSDGAVTPETPSTALSQETEPPGASSPDVADVPLGERDHSRV